MDRNLREKIEKSKKAIRLATDMNDVANGGYDFTDNGVCSSCGSCCSALLPLSADEIYRIKQYIKRHNVKEQKHLIPLADTAFDLTCPFLDASKAKDKCTIYPVRPEICKSFNCANILGKCTPELLKGTRVPVDMRETFFGK